MKLENLGRVRGHENCGVSCRLLFFLQEKKSCQGPLVFLFSGFSKSYYVDNIMLYLLVGFLLVGRCFGY